MLTLDSLHRSDYVLHRDDVSFRLMAAMRLRLVNPFHKASVGTQLAIAQWHNVVNGELDQISPENEQMVPVHIERLCNQIMMNAKQNLNALVCPWFNCCCHFFLGTCGI